MLIYFFFIFGICVFLLESLGVIVICFIFDGFIVFVVCVFIVWIIEFSESYVDRCCCKDCV